MKLEHSFTVPVPPAQAWEVLLDVQRIAPCMPGATVETVDGDEITGKVKVKVGPIVVTYGGTARFVEKDAETHRVVLEARGKETRGSGTAQATVTGTLHPDGAGTRVEVVTDLAVTGKPAQFGRGVMADVGGKIIGQFADCLAGELGSGGSAASPPPAAPPGATGAAPTSPGDHPSPAGLTPPPPEPSSTGWTPPPAGRPTSDVIDLFDTAGGPLARRLAPGLGAFLAFAAILVLWRRRRRRR